MPKEKLLYVTHDYWWDTDVHILDDLAEQYDLEVWCFSPVEGGKYPDKKYNGKYRLVNYRHEPLTRKNPKMVLASLWFALEILMRSRKSKYTFILPTHNIYAFPLLIRFLNPAKTIFSFHNYELHSDASWKEKYIRRHILKRFRFYHFQSQGQEELFRRDHPDLPSFHTTMLPKDYGEPTGRFNIKEVGKKVFLFFGAFRAYKRPEWFIKAANACHGMNGKFVMAGDCHYDFGRYSSLIEHPEDFENHIRFIDNDEIPDLFTQADFLVLPYKDATQSGPMLIAMQYNLPVIASDIDTFSHLVEDGKDGLLFNADSLDDLTTTLKKAVAMTDDEYKSIKQGQRKRVVAYKKDCEFAQRLIDFAHTAMASPDKNTKR